MKMLPSAVGGNAEKSHWKDHDNTWLQLPVCPKVLNKTRCEDGEDKCSYAHPPKHVLEHKLSNSHVVSCFDFVFSHSQPDFFSGQGPRRRCTRTNCKFFHPPLHLRLLVINAGKNNKRLKCHLERQQQLLYQQQMAALTIWMQQQQQPVNNGITLSSNPVYYNPLQHVSGALSLPASPTAPLLPPLQPQSLLPLSPPTTIAPNRPAQVEKEPEPPGTCPAAPAGINNPVCSRKRSFTPQDGIRPEDPNKKKQFLPNNLQQHQQPQQLWNVPNVCQQLVLPNGSLIPVVNPSYPMPYLYHQSQ